MRTISLLVLLTISPIAVAIAELPVELYRFTWDTSGDLDGWTSAETVTGGPGTGLILQADVTDANWEEQDPDGTVPPVDEPGVIPYYRYVNLNGKDPVQWPWGNEVPQSGGALQILRNNGDDGWVGPRLPSFSNWWDRQTMKEWLVANKGVSADAMLTSIEFNECSGPLPAGQQQSYVWVDFWFKVVVDGNPTGLRVRKTNLSPWGSTNWNPMKWARTTYSLNDIKSGTIISGSAAALSSLSNLNDLVGITFNNAKPGLYGKFLDDVRIFGIIVPPVSTIADARTAPLGTTVQLDDAVVTAKFAGAPGLPESCFYVQEGNPPDPPVAGIRVVVAPDSIFATLQPGDHVAVRGTTSLENGEIQLNASIWSIVSTANPLPNSLGTSTRTLAGYSGISPRALWSAAFGKVTEVNSTEKYLLIDDGAGVPFPQPRMIVQGGFDELPKSQWYIPSPWVWYGYPVVDNYTPAWYYIPEPADPQDPNEAIWGINPHGGRGWMGLASGSPKNQRVGGAYQVVSGFTAGETRTIEAFGIAASDQGGARVRLGVDPTGGTDPLSPNVIWAAWITSSTWTRTQVTFQAAGPSATVFLELDQTAVTGGYTATCFDDVRVLPAPGSEKFGIKVYCDFAGGPMPNINDYLTLRAISGSENMPTDLGPVLISVLRAHPADIMVVD